MCFADGSNVECERKKKRPRTTLRFGLMMESLREAPREGGARSGSHFGHDSFTGLTCWGDIQGETLRRQLDAGVYCPGQEPKGRSKHSGGKREV